MSKHIELTTIEQIRDEEQRALDLLANIEGFLTSLNKINSQIYRGNSLVSNYESLPFHEPIRSQRDKNQD